MSNNFDELINKIRNSNMTIRDKGTAFEKLVVSYLINEPTYKNQFSNVWLLKDVPNKYGISKNDTGVDIVARNTNTGDLTAIQAKFYQTPIKKAQLNSFMAEMNQKYYVNGIFVSTVDDWDKEAEHTITKISKPVSVIGLSQLRHANIDWSLYDNNNNNTDNLTIKKKDIRDYQQDAINNALKYYDDHDRGKLIMAPGTGKTFTSLKIAEALKNHNNIKNFKVLYLVPSVQLLSQTLRNWNNDISNNINLESFAVTADSKATKKSNTDDSIFAPQDIGFPATTDVNQLLNNYSKLNFTGNYNMTVFFSTYQSIDVIKQAQNNGLPDFDLIIADEAHRTASYYKSNEQEGLFTKVHYNENVKSKMRLYQTATPKIYSENAKHKSKENSIVIASMDNPNIYGKEFYHLGFGEAVSRNILTDYKVSVLTIDENFVQKDMQQALSKSDNGLDTNDIGKIIGVWNAMMKRKSFSDKVTDSPMKRAIAFSSVIDNQKGRSKGKVGSKQIASEFSNVINEYLGAKADSSYNVEVKHVDGSMNASKKNSVIDWLASPIDYNKAKILSNVKFLNEGIDVPNLDAVIFFAPKKSQVDIVQAVGRVMRKSEGKNYGYVILPIVIPSGTDPASILNNNKKYREVWQVLNALRSVDERFDAMVNKLDLNKNKPANLDVIGQSVSPGKSLDEDTYDKDNNDANDKQYKQIELALNWPNVQNAIYGKIVKKVGNRRYLEDWTNDVQKIAQRQIRWIYSKLEDNDDAFNKEFNKFLKSLKYNINEGIDTNQAAEMLAQHLITKPIFEAMFSQYNFIKDNPVSRSIEKMIKYLKNDGFNKEQESLKPFYKSVALRAQNIDNEKGKQEFIKTLYNNFFKEAFGNKTNKFGVTYTPISIVDFIINSVDYSLKKYLNSSLINKNVHILDPFTGTGSFIVRILHFFKRQIDQGEITLADITRKYTRELHANEIMLLSYYIATINIESAYDDISKSKKYVTFDGIVLTDTFASYENEHTLDDDMFGNNNKRLQKQQENPITVVMSNPPYSKGSNNTNDGQKNVDYPKLDKRIQNTYKKSSKSTNTLYKTLYNSYIKAIRWASDRIGQKGIIGFVTDGSFLNTKSTSGLRHCLYNEFNHLYIYNLRGNKMLAGEVGRQEGGQIFGQGSRSTIAISILIKDNSNNHEIFYKDIGKYVSRDTKLSIINNNNSIKNINWEQIIPDNNDDWIIKNNQKYQKYWPLSSKKGNYIFYNNAMGVQTSRDTWSYGFSKSNVANNIYKLIVQYNQERKKLKINNNYKLNTDSTHIKWSNNLKKSAKRDVNIKYNSNELILTLYRPFTKKWLYYDKNLVERPRLYRTKFGKNNIVIYTTGRGSSRLFSAFATRFIPDYKLNDNGQGFMRYDNETQENTLFKQSKDNMNSNFAHKLGVSNDDAFYYIYGILHSNEYKNKYQNDLRKDLARIPIVNNIKPFIRIGKKLMDLHLNYENVAPFRNVDIEYKNNNPSYRVEKMRHPTPQRKNLDIIEFNSDITIKNIPIKAYDYVINGRPAIEWIIDQYRIKTDTKYGIVDDPNNFSENPKYIFNLLLSVINVSVKTIKLVNSLPKMDIIDETDTH